MSAHPPGTFRMPPGWRLLVVALAVAAAGCAGPRASVASRSGRATWYRLRLAGPRITASVNGRIVVSLTDHADARGLAGIASTWSTVQFTDVTVTRG